MEKNVRSQNLKFSVEFPDDDRESHGVSNFEVVKKRKATGDNNLAEGETDEAEHTREVHEPEVGEFEWDIEPVKTETVNDTHNKVVPKVAQHIKNEKHISETVENIKTSNQYHKDARKAVVRDKNEKTVGETRTGEKQNVKTLTEPRSKPKETRFQTSDVSERLYKRRKVWEKDQYRKGPGPAHYMLPTTVGRKSFDLTKRQSPAFSFGSRSFSIKSDSPGPAYQFDPLLGTRGKENTPAYSFGGRPRTPSRRDFSPGPGAYNTDIKPLWEKNAPKYSLSPRNRMRPIDPVPSPGSYEIPTTLGAKVPHMKGGTASSMVGKSDYMSYSADLAKSPGPAYYPAFSPNLVKRKSPEFSIKGRHINNNIKNPTPGPGAYSPENALSHMPNSPRAVIGVRHSEFKMPTLTPADIS